MNVNVRFVKLRDGAQTPTRGSEKAAGYDLHACLPDGIEYIWIAPGMTEKIGTGLAITPPEGYWGAILARSGLATKQGLRPANCVGACDEDYTGEYIVALHNDSHTARLVRNGDRIAQLTFLPYLNINFEEVEKLEQTDRGEGGFGSTGK